MLRHLTTRALAGALFAGLAHVDEVGFADLVPGSGQGSGGYVNVASFEVYGTPVKRSPGAR